MTQLTHRSTSWLYVAGGAAVGLVAWRAVVRRKQQRLASQRLDKALPVANARSGSTRTAPIANDRHRPLGSASSQLKPSLHGLAGGPKQADVPNDSDETTQSREDGRATVDVTGPKVGLLFHPELKTSGATAHAEPKTEEESVPADGEGSVGPEPIFELRSRHNGDETPLHSSEGPLERPPIGALPYAFREGTKLRRPPDE